MTSPYYEHNSAFTFAVLYTSWTLGFEMEFDELNTFMCLGVTNLQLLLAP
jgi:hypothetical protein